MTESAQSQQNGEETSQNTLELIHKRLEDLQKRRQDLVEKLEQEMALALAPLDASIKELRWMLSQLSGEAANAPEYNLFKRQPSQAPQSPAPANVAQFKPTRAQPTKDLPPPSFVESPKSSTPVPTNEGILRQALGKRR